jgi:YfiH family protein
MPVVDHDTYWEWTAPGVRAVFTTREGGVSRAPFDTLNVGAHVGDDPADVAENRRRAARLVGLGADRVAGVTQVHGADVWLDLRRGSELPDEVRWDRGAAGIEADALVTTRTDAALAVGVADCVPIAIVMGDAIAAVHAGWRSLERGIVEATLAVLRRAAGSSLALQAARPHAVVGPCLGSCCMEVGEEVAARFDPSIVLRLPDQPRPFLALRADARRRLAAGGCVVERIDACTKDDPRCFSHRGDQGRGGRQAVLVRRRAVGA